MADLLAEKHNVVLENVVAKEDQKVFDMLNEMIQAINIAPAVESMAAEYNSPFVLPSKKYRFSPNTFFTNNPMPEPVKAKVTNQGKVMRQYYYATYSDEEQKYDVFNDLKSAVRTFSRDVMGHTLVHIRDENGTILWHVEGGYHPKQPMAERAIENTGSETVDRFIKDYSPHFANYIQDQTTGSAGANTGVVYSFEDGVITLKDAKGMPRKTFKIIIEEVALVKHKFNSEFKCETCGRHMAAIPEPTGLCLLEEQDELPSATEEAQDSE